MKVYSDEIEQSVFSPDILGAKIRKLESTTDENEVLNGDSFLINLKRRIFAVADSPDWNHWKSRDFLDEFNQMIETTLSEYPDLLSDVRCIERTQKIIAERTNQLIHDSTYLETTTFTALIVVGDRVAGQKEKLGGIMLHCGDTCLYEADLKSKRVVQLSTPDLCFVGKTKKLSQVKITTIDEHTRYILCSDGLMVLLRNRNFPTFEDLLLDSLQNNPAHKVPETLIHHYGRGIDLHDDITAIALDPNKLAGDGSTYLYGSEEL